MNQKKPPAELVAAKYRLTRLLGQGGMGSVWEGVHISLGSRVACKFVELDFVDSPEARSRFENEARAAASLKSKHVVDVYDHGVMPDGRPYIVMEYLSGEALDQRLEKRGQLSLEETATLVHQVSRALAKAHEKGIVHRDLKPENVFLVWDDEDEADLVKVVDFGIAKFTQADSLGSSSQTKTGSVLGTPYYMSPEQARGLKNLDARSDIWSLGVIAYQSMTGELPFRGEAVGDLLVNICTGSPCRASELNPAISEALDEWFFKSLAREPDARFQDVRTQAAELMALVSEEAQFTRGGLAVEGENSQPTPHQHQPKELTSESRNRGRDGSSVSSAEQTVAAFSSTSAVASPPKKNRLLRPLLGLATFSALAGGAYFISQLQGGAPDDELKEQLQGSTEQAPVVDVPKIQPPSESPMAEAVSPDVATSQRPSKQNEVSKEIAQDPVEPASDSQQQAQKPEKPEPRATVKENSPSAKKNSLTVPQRRSYREPVSSAKKGKSLPKEKSASPPVEASPKKEIAPSQAEPAE
ncbi:MAG: protein kinase [Polyangiaceae bacterium]|nr:protein kinase [Polyangiaceae bacterium]